MAKREIFDESSQAFQSEVIAQPSQEPRRRKLRGNICPCEATTLSWQNCEIPLLRKLKKELRQLSS